VTPLEVAAVEEAAFPCWTFAGRGSAPRGRGGGGVNKGFPKESIFDVAQDTMNCYGEGSPVRGSTNLNCTGTFWAGVDHQRQGRTRGTMSPAERTRCLLAGGRPWRWGGVRTTVGNKEEKWAMTHQRKKPHSKLAPVAGGTVRFETELPSRLWREKVTWGKRGSKK